LNPRLLRCERYSRRLGHLHRGAKTASHLRGRLRVFPDVSQRFSASRGLGADYRLGIRDSLSATVTQAGGLRSFRSSGGLAAASGASGRTCRRRPPFAPMRRGDPLPRSRRTHIEEKARLTAPTMDRPDAPKQPLAMRKCRNVKRKDRRSSSLALAVVVGDVVLPPRDLQPGRLLRSSQEPGGQVLTAPWLDETFR
jgi:hypothetical protein